MKRTHKRIVQITVLISQHGLLRVLNDLEIDFIQIHMFSIVSNRNEIITTVCLMMDTNDIIKRVVNTLKSSLQPNMVMRLQHSARAAGIKNILFL